MSNYSFWVAEVKWKLTAYYKQYPDLERAYKNVDFAPVTIEYFGPFTSYDEGIKVWSAKFSSGHEGEIEYINYHKLRPYL